MSEGLLLKASVDLHTSLFEFFGNSSGVLPRHLVKLGFGVFHFKSERIVFRLALRFFLKPPAQFGSCLPKPTARNVLRPEGVSCV